VAISLPVAQVRALHRASGRGYTATLVNPYRLYRQAGHLWLSPLKHDRVLKAFCGPSFLHAHSYQAAQQDFYEACKTAKALKLVNPRARYPYKRKYFHTTTWKHTGIKVMDGRMRLALARGHDPIWVALPAHLATLPPSALRQVQLVYNHATKRSCWHITIDDGIVPQPTPHTGIMAVDLGEIHPAACTNGEQATIIACRALRANGQHRNKKTADVQEMIARCQPGSRRGKKLVASRKRLQAQTDTRQRDLLHKVSRAVVQAAQAMQAGTIVLGDGRDVADNTKTEKRLSRENRQQISTWPHGQLRHYITYKAVAVGITTELINEAYTSTTCPKCGQRNQPKGRHYRCSACGFVGHRDNVGSTVRRFGADKIPFPERSGWEQQTARTTAYLAAKAKGDNSMLLKRGNPKIGRIVCPASPVRMVRLTCQTLVSSDATHRLS
jgi:putative transposase